jgi:hypothetical protein
MREQMLQPCSLPAAAHQKTITIAPAAAFTAGLLMMSLAEVMSTGCTLFSTCQCLRCQVA